MTAAEAQKHLKNYLTGIYEMKLRMAKGRRPGLRRLGMEDFVLSEGVVFDKFLPCPKSARGLQRECYKNAARIADGQKLIYCEGFAVPAGFPLPTHHAWVVTPAGEVIDPTWRDYGLAYWGVPFTRDYVVRTMLATEVYGVMENHRQNFPLLRPKRCPKHRHPAFPIKAVEP